MKKSDFYFYLLVQAKLNARSFCYLQDIFGDPDNIIQAVYNHDTKIPPKILLAIEKILEQKEKHHQQYAALAPHFTILDPGYPEILKNIYDPPLLLYYAGNLDLLQSSYLLTMIGSRQVSSYHEQSAKKIINELSSSPMVVVSGLAVGLDTICHQAALENNLATIAVLGSGLDQASFYPQSNWRLSQDIIKQGGLMLSEYPIGTRPALHQFPKRNRILAGLSRATAVISGAEKSGTLITAQCALDNGREVFALPGNINQKLCQGTNLLLKNGANFLLSGSDLLNYYNLDQKTITKNKTISLTTEEKTIIKILEVEGQCLENLQKATGWDIPKINAILSSLEIKNLVQYNLLSQVELK